MDYEQLNEYAMCVQARPGLRARRKRSLDLSAQDLNKADVAYINFVVVDENDNGPRFPEQELVAGRCRTFSLHLDNTHIQDILEEHQL